MKESKHLKNPLSQESRNNALLSPEQIGDSVKVTVAPVYLLSTAVLLLLGAFIVWGFLGNVTDKAYYSGVVYPAKGTVDIVLPNSGMVRKMLVHKGDSVHQGQTVAFVEINGSYSFLASNVDGLVISSKGDNDSFESLEPIASVIERDALGGLSQRTQLVAYADYESQRTLRVGMEAQVWPSDEKRDEIGYIHGRITKVVRYPASVDEIRETLKSDILAQKLQGLSDAVYEVRIDLFRSAEDSTKYDWSFGEPTGASKVLIGTLCDVLTETRRRSMFEYLFDEAKSKFRAVNQTIE